MFIFSNLATSIDGKIATQSRAYFPLGTPADRKLMQVLRRRSDAILMGAGTLRTFRRPLLVSGAKRQPVNVVLSSKLEGLSPSWPFFKTERIRKIVFVGYDCPEARVKKFSRLAEVYRLKKGTPRNPTAIQIVRALEKLGIRKLLVEGGGSIMWDFVHPNLIDEMYVTLTPRALGGTEAPTLIDGSGFQPREVVNFTLKSCRRVGDELYLVYKKSARRGP